MFPIKKNPKKNVLRNKQTIFYIQWMVLVKEFVWTKQNKWKLWNLVQLSIYSTRALFCKYFVAMKYRWICKFLVLSKSSPLRLLCIDKLQHFSSASTFGSAYLNSLIKLPLFVYWLLNSWQITSFYINYTAQYLFCVT